MGKSSKGIKTSEFWLSAVATLVGGVLASGLISNALALQMLGGAASLLAALGYSASRAWVKSNEAKASFMVEALKKKAD